jgi:putative endonuclease
MKGWRRQRGQEGEQIAAAFLQRQGYVIKERNYRNRKGEIDIIAWHEATLVFVEVKTKTQAAFGHPAEMVDRRKQQTLTQVAMTYVQRHQLIQTALRFDVVAVRLRPEAAPDVTHILGAFDPSGHFFY